MSDLFRKEALENRSRALYGEVTLKNSVGNWLLTLIIIAVFLLGLALLFGIHIDTETEPVRLITYLINKS